MARSCGFMVQSENILTVGLSVPAGVECGGWHRQLAAGTWLFSVLKGCRRNQCRPGLAWPRFYCCRRFRHVWRHTYSGRFCRSAGQCQQRRGSGLHGLNHQRRNRDEFSQDASVVVCCCGAGNNLACRGRFLRLKFFCPDGLQPHQTEHEKDNRKI